MQVGADPTHGGKGGESAFYEAFGSDHHASEVGEVSGWNCKRRFFVFVPECSEPIKQWQPRVYSVVACIGENCSPTQNTFTKILLIVLSCFQGFCSPALKFHFGPDNPIKFNCDETFDQTTPMAGFTEEPISSDHIGLYGSFSEGLNRQWAERIQSNPWQFTKGLLKLITAIALVALSVFAVIHFPVVSTILLVYGAVKGVQILGQFFLPLLYNSGNCQNF